MPSSLAWTPMSSPESFVFSNTGELLTEINRRHRLAVGVMRDFRDHVVVVVTSHDARYEFATSPSSLCYYMTTKRVLSVRPSPRTSMDSSPARSESLRGCTDPILCANDKRRTSMPNILRTIVQWRVCWLGHVLRRPVQSHLNVRSAIYKLVTNSWQTTQPLEGSRSLGSQAE